MEIEGTVKIDSQPIRQPDSSAQVESERGELRGGQAEQQKPEEIKPEDAGNQIDLLA